MAILCKKFRADVGLYLISRSFRVKIADIAKKNCSNVHFFSFGVNYVTMIVLIQQIQKLKLKFTTSTLWSMVIRVVSTHPYWPEPMLS